MIHQKLLLIIDLALVLSILFFHGLTSQLKLVLPQHQLLLSSIKSFLVELRLLTKIFKLGLHIQFLSFNALFFLSLSTLSILLFLFKLLGFLLHKFHHLLLLSLEFSLLNFIAFFLYPLLRSFLSEFQLIEGHVPIDSLIIFVLFLS